MNDRALNNLIAMAQEARSLDPASAVRDASTIDAGADLGIVRHHAVSHTPQPARSHRRWFAVGGTGLVAAVVAIAAGLMFVHSAPSPSHQTAVAKASEAEAPIDSVPEPARSLAQNVHAGERVAVRSLPVDPNALEGSIVVAIYVDEAGVSHCVQWGEHGWSNNRCLSDVPASEVRSVRLGEPCSTDARQVVLVALSGPRSMLPATDIGATQLAQCIARAGQDCEHEGACYLHAASDCLPSGVSVRVQTVAMNR